MGLSSPLSEPALEEHRFLEAHQEADIPEKAISHRKDGALGLGKNGTVQLLA